MDERIKVIVAIPVYNHAGTIRQVAEGVLRHYGQVLVVDDGSAEPVAPLLEDLAVEVLAHSRNKGKGAAIRSAAAWALEHGYTHMICLDADGQHDPNDLPVFFSEIAQHPKALIVGHRDFSHESVPGSSRFGRKFSNFWLRLQTGIRLKDCQSGFRAYPLFVFEHLSFWTRKYNFEIEVLVRSAWAGVELRDVDISVYYPCGEERISHFRLFMDNWRLTMLNTHLTLRSVVPWPHRKIIERESSDKKSVQTVSVVHPMRSIRQLLRENSSPERLAVAAGVGVLLGTLPLVFCHTVVILFVCGFFNLNKVAAVSSSQFCMPPVVPALCIELGYYLRHGEWLTELSLQTLGYQAPQRFFEWIIGSLVLAPLLAVVVWALTLFLALIIVKKDEQTV
ncbi:MAG: DUF2062 domain-containing protein [Deltaproteobacteria bacterium]|nr:DUF2062 domain-containing protein [Deltaproteobacteria bacterium]